ALRLAAPAQAPGDPAPAAPGPIPEPVLEPPELDLPTGLPPLRRLDPDLGQHRVLDHRPGRAALDLLEPDPERHHPDRRRPDLARVQDAAAAPGRVEPGPPLPGLPPVLQLPGGRAGAVGASGPGGAHAAVAGQVPRVPGNRKRLEGLPGW